MNDETRKAFEAWYSSRHDGFVPGFYDGEYDWDDAQPCWDAWQAALQSQTAPAVPEGDKALAKIIKDAHMEGQKSASGREGTEFRWLNSDAKVAVDNIITAAPQPTRPRNEVATLACQEAERLRSNGDSNDE